MRTKIVYSVVSTPSDNYLEQTLMSVYSLRRYNPTANVVMVVDETTSETIVGKRGEIKKYVDQVTTISVPTEYTNTQKSRFLKTTLREHVKGDFFFIDSDTLVTEDLSAIDNFDCEIGATADKHVSIGIHPMKVYIAECAEAANFKMEDSLTYFNSGAMLVKDTERAHSFYKEWHKQWLLVLEKGIVSDQASLAKANEVFGYFIRDIGGEWNCQLEDNGLRYMEKAKIIHYFASTAKKEIKSPFTYYQAPIYKRIKETGEIPDDIKEIIKHPKRGFLERCRIIANDDLDFMASPVHKLFLQAPKYYQYLSWLSRFFLKIS